MKIFAALMADINDNRVWLKENSLPARSIVQIKNNDNGKKIFCEALQFDENFFTRSRGRTKPTG